MDNLFDASVQSEQFQVGQKNVAHVNYGACEVTKIEIYQGKLFYEVVIESTKMRIKCISTRLRTIEVQS